jgi:hypothetical protein
MTRLRILGFSGSLVAAALIGGTIMSSVFAASPAPTDPATFTGDRAPTEACRTFRAAFAANLGVTEDQMVAAAKAAIGTTVDDAVADGRLTAAAGERIKARVAEADGDGCRILAGWRGPIVRAALGVARDGMTAAADALDMSVLELRQALRDGATLKEVAAAEGVPYETVSSAVVGAVKADLDAAVAAGTISQARADRILERLETRLADGGLRRP